MLMVWRANHFIEHMFSVLYIKTACQGSDNSGFRLLFFCCYALLCCRKPEKIQGELSVLSGFLSDGSM